MPDLVLETTMQDFTNLQNHAKDSFELIIIIVAEQNVSPNGSTTIRHGNCQSLLPAASCFTRCTAYSSHRRVLYAMDSRSAQIKEISEPTSHTNYRYLSSPVKNKHLSLPLSLSCIFSFVPPTDVCSISVKSLKLPSVSNESK